MPRSRANARKDERPNESKHLTFRIHAVPQKADFPLHTGGAIASLKYPARRKNIPPAGLGAQGKIQEAPKIRYEYDPCGNEELRALEVRG